MKIKYFAAVFAASLGLLMFNFTSAHEHDVYQIGDKQYTFVVGSLNEPVVVDDKTGLDLNVTSGGGMAIMSPDGDMDGPAAKSEPALGLEKNLKVEISAGSQKKTLDLTPSWGKPGSYYATFYPTIQTTYAYRVMGTLNNLPVDLTFTCNPAPSSAQAEDKTSVQLSEKVSRISKSGAFGCPMAKADLGFPVSSMSNADLSAKVDSMASKNSAATLPLGAAVLSLLAILIAGYSAVKK